MVFEDVRFLKADLLEERIEELEAKVEALTAKAKEARIRR